MTSIGSPSPFFLAGKKAYEVERSLRFNGADNAYLARTITTTGNRKTFTFSGWVKRSNITTSAVVRIFNCNITTNPGGTPGQEVTHVGFNTDDTIYFAAEDSSDNGYGVTVAKYRDPSAWMHLLYVVDTTESAAADRIKVFVNGVQQTLTFTTNVAQNADTQTNLAGAVMSIGAIYFNGTLYMNSPFYLAEANFIDGQALTPSSFTETDVITGQLIPKKYIGSYGTNGFYLNFSDNSSTSALGTDSSGNSNNFTVNNLSVSAGVGNDSVTDTPTNNFATLNPLSLPAAGGTFSNGNLDFTADSNYATRTGNISLKTGKWYWEVIITNIGTDLHGIVQGSHPDGNCYPGYDTNGNVKGIGWYHASGGLLYGAVPDGATNGATIGAGNTALPEYTTNDVLGFASDIANGTLAFYKNGTLEYTLTGIGSHDWFPAVCGYGTSSTKTINFGQLKADSTSYSDANGHGSFKYSVPSGFLAMCTANLPNPTIMLPNKHFETLTYEGNGSSPRTISGLQFSPDFVWLKHRNSTSWHRLQNSVIGANKLLYSNSTNAEATDESNGHLNSFTSDGFIIDDPNSDALNNSNGTYVGWNWNAGDTDGATYKVVVVSDSGNKYRFRNSADSATFAVSAVELNLAEGGTYVFDWSDSSAQSHPIRFSTTADGTHGGGSEYTTGVVKDDSAYKTTITVAASAPQLYYYCQSHSGMGGAINTNSTLGSSNFDGDVTPADEVPTVKANPTAGFSIVSYKQQTGTYHIGHGLGVAPQLIITKTRSAANSWWTHTTAIDGGIDYGGLNLRQAFQDSGVYGIGVPTSLVFEDDTDFTSDNADNIAYLFSSVDGYSRVGRYTGNGLDDGTFVFTGFRPAWLLIKANLSESWYIYDNKRNTFNVVDKEHRADHNYAETTFTTADFLSNGFKLRQTDSAVNQGGSTYIYLAFAESPFKNARAR